MRTKSALLLLLTLFIGAEAGAATPSWTPIGPFGGPVNQIVFDPAQPGVVYVATLYHGVFKSTDSGATWQAASNGIPAVANDLGVFELNNTNGVALDPNIEGRVYAATNAGLYQSTDSGAHWTQLTDFSAYDVAVDPLNSHVIYFTQVQIGASGGNFAISDTGVFLPMTKAPGLFPCATITITPAGVLFCSGRGMGLQRSADGGVTWQSVTPSSTNPLLTIEDIPVVAAPSNPEVVYLPGYRSDDAGMTWKVFGASPLPSSVPESGLGQWIAVDPNDADVVYAFNGYRMMRSIDGGQDWTAGNYDPALTAPDLTTPVAIDPKHPSHVLVGEFASWNDGLDFFESNMGLLASDAHAMVSDSNTPPHLFVGTGEHLYQGIEGGARWEKMDSCQTYMSDVTRMDIDHGNNGYVYATGITPFGDDGFALLTPGATDWVCTPETGATDIVTSPTQSGTVYIDQADPIDGFNYLLASNNFGQSLTLIQTTGDSYETVGLAVSYLTPGLVYTDVNGVVYRTTDGGMSWTQLSAEPYGPSDPIALAISAASDNVLLAMRFGSVERSANAGSSWTSVFTTASKETENGFFMDQGAPGTDYLLLNDGVAESKDDGATWGAPDYAGLSGHSVTAMFHSTAYPQYFYAATADAGVFALTVPTDLSVAISGVDGTILPVNGSGTYSVTVSNNSNVTATHLWLTLIVPSTYAVSGLSTAGGLCKWEQVVGAPDKLICSYPALAGGSSWAISFTGTPTAAGPGGLYASVASMEGDSDWVDNAAARYFISGGTADMAVTAVAASGAPAAGAFGPVATITVTNHGASADNADVVIHVPSGLKGVQAVASGGSCFVTSGVIDCHLAALVSGHSTTIQLSGSPASTGNAIISASAMPSSVTDDDLANNYAVVSLRISAAAQSSGAKTLSAGARVDESKGTGQSSPVLSQGSSSSGASANPSKGNSTQGGGAFSLLSGLLLLGLGYTRRRRAIRA